MQTRSVQKGLAVAVPALVFGFLVAAQWSTFAAPGASDVGIRYVDPLTSTVTRLQDEQKGLKAQVADLRTKLDALQQAGATQTGTAQTLTTRLQGLKERSGLTEATGEGVTMTLSAPRAPLTEERAQCLAPDLTDLVNAAWRAGARAVAINDERIVGSSSVYCIGGTIVVNGSIVAAPFAVAAIGPASRILGVVDDPAQLTDLKRRRDQQVIDLRVARAPALALPAYAGPVLVRSAVTR